MIHSTDCPVQNGATPDCCRGCLLGVLPSNRAQVHQVYQSYEKRKERLDELAKGEITKAESEKRKQLGLLQDAASVGIAALGIKGAYSEWKEMKELRDERVEFGEKMKKHHEHRLLKEAAHNSSDGHHDADYDSKTGHSTSDQPSHAEGSYQGSYQSSDMPSGYYPETLSAQHGGYYPDPNLYTPQSGMARGPSPAVAHYVDGNPYSVGGGVPLPPEPPQPGVSQPSR